MSLIKHFKILCLLFVFAFIGSFSYRKYSKKSLRIPAGSSVVQPVTELGEIWTSEDQKNASEITNIIENALEERTAGGTLMKRDAHLKHHGCVKAFFDIDAKLLTSSQQVGIFSKDSPKQFLAWIRFSNGDPDSTKADADGDVRGMSIKLMNVKNAVSGSQDFLLMNSKSFFIKDSSEYLDL